MPPDAMAPLSEALSSFTAVIVTGGSSGIGKSFIELLHTMSPEIQFCNLSRREPVIKSAGLKLRHIPCDLSQYAAIAPAADLLIGWLKHDVPHGRVLLINNSGFGAYGCFPEPDVAHLLEMVDLNIRAVVELTARLMTTLRERGGAIINVASTAAFQPTAYMAVYGATKAFVLHWSLALNEELRGSGLRALAVCPGPTSTEFFWRAGLKEGSVADALGMTSEEVAMASLHALAAGRSLVVTGWKNKVGAFFSSKLPKSCATWLAAKVLARFRLNQVRR